MGIIMIVSALTDRAKTEDFSRMVTTSGVQGKQVRILSFQAPVTWKMEDTLWKTRTERELILNVLEIMLRLLRNYPSQQH